MKRIVMSVLAVAVAVTFTAPTFAGEKKEEKKSGHVVMYGDEKKDKGGKANETFSEKKEEKKRDHADTFGDKKEEKKGQ